MAMSKSGNKGSVTDRSSAAEEQSLSQTVEGEARAASDTLHSATGQVRSKVAELGTDMQKAAFNQIGSLQKRAAVGINGFADTVEDAGRVFADKQSPRVARLVQEGAWALRDLAGSLSEKPIADVAQDVRSYGRTHPAILVGGAMLAGVAIGRLLRSAPVASSSGNNGRQRLGLIDPDLPPAETVGLAGGEL